MGLCLWALFCVTVCVMLSTIFVEKPDFCVTVYVTMGIKKTSVINPYNIKTYDTYPQFELKKQLQFVLHIATVYVISSIYSKRNK